MSEIGSAGDKELKRLASVIAAKVEHAEQHFD